MEQIMQQRWFHRVLFTAKSVITLDDVSFRGQIENISLNGTLVSFDKDVIVTHGDKCFLSIYPAGENEPIRIIAEVMHCSHNMVGMKFVALDTDTQFRLYDLVKKITTEPEKLDVERDRLKGYLAEYLMPLKNIVDPRAHTVAAPQ